MSGPIVTFDEEAARGELRELVRQTVEDTLNALLEEEADDLIGAGHYERAAGREAYRAGHYERGAHHIGPVTLKGMRFAAAIIERCRRRETSVEEAHDRDVPGRRVHQAHRGRLQGPVGVERLGRHRLQPQREGARGR